MDITKYYAIEGEKPLDFIPSNGGLSAIFRTIACIGDSMSSGEHESVDENGTAGFHGLYEHSWGQYMARTIGAKVYNFSRGGMTSAEYCQSYAEEQGFWNPEFACQAYILALGLNELTNTPQKVGTTADICLDDHTKNNMETFAGCYGRIIQKYREIEPKSRMFLMTIPKRTTEEPDYSAKLDAHAALLYKIAEMFPFTYVIDLRNYVPAADEKFLADFHLGYHMNAAGYRMIALMVMSYIDYIIRNNPEDFTQVGFIGKGGIHNKNAKW